MQMWTPVFACPSCRATVARVDHAWVCASCDIRFEQRGGVHCFLTAGRLAAAAGFISHYRGVRRADGHAATAVARFARLPEVSADDPNAGEWRIRQQSFQTFLARVWGNGATPLRVLDAGAGNGWLSHRLAALGARPVAVDLDDDDQDGLRVAERAAASMALVQADFDALPFLPGQFDAVVLNASLHYAPDPDQTLLEANRMVAPGGALVVMDSPMFVHESDGAAMNAQQAAARAAFTAGAAAVRPGVGFLTFDRLRDAASRLNRRSQFVPSQGPLGWRLRRAWSRRRLGRAPAAFGVWVAR